MLRQFAHRSNKSLLTVPRTRLLTDTAVTPIPTIMIVELVDVTTIRTSTTSTHDLTTLELVTAFYADVLDLRDWNHAGTALAISDMVTSIVRTGQK